MTIENNFQGDMPPNPIKPFLFLNCFLTGSAVAPGWHCAIIVVLLHFITINFKGFKAFGFINRVSKMQKRKYRWTTFIMQSANSEFCFDLLGLISA